jgi:oligoendopeptidase F
MTKGTDQIKTGAEEIRWDLSDLFPSPAAMEESLGKAGKEAIELEKKYRNRVSELNPKELCTAIEKYEQFGSRMNRAFTYVFLNWCTDTLNPERGALMQKVRERHMLITQNLLFFEIEMTQMDPDRLGHLIKEPALRRYRHYLELMRQRRDHVRSEPEEKILSEKSVTGGEAWGRFFDQILSAAQFTFQDRKVSEQEILSKLYDPSREIRQDAAESFTRGLEERIDSLTFVFNTSLGDKASDDRIREYRHWLSSRNQSNEISDRAVNALIKSVTSRYDLVARYYTLKKRLLGLEELFDWDRYAPVSLAGDTCHWEEARKTVLAAYSSFDPRMEEIASRFFENHWIDAAMTSGKRSGAFSHAAVTEVHPYVLMNYTGTVRDVQTLAHELGHGIHQYLARKQGPLQARTPLTTSETASVFGEMLVFEKLVRQESDPRRKLDLLISKIDDSMATVFRQISMNKFEEKIHLHRRQKGELSVDQLSDYWVETQSAMFQGSVTLSPNYRIWWSYIPHFIHTPGYVYAYAFGELLVLALYALYRKNPDGFPQQYIELLEAGGSDWPHTLVGRLGVDLNDQSFWNNGLGEIEKMIGWAEELSA